MLPKNLQLNKEHCVSRRIFSKLSVVEEMKWGKSGQMDATAFASRRLGEHGQKYTVRHVLPKLRGLAEGSHVEHERKRSPYQVL